ncbi:MAG: PEGA domain-containing protein [Myxococcales bacterium]|nr:PEGA domain-containing protein [Myxococcales bacterium]
MALLRIAIGLLIALGASGVARAQRAGAVVVPAAEPAIDPVALAAALAGVGVDAPDALDVALAARRAGAEPRARVAQFAKVAAVVAEGWRAYVAADPEFAAARLAAARTAAEDLLTLDGGLEVYADASLRLGVALLHLGRTEAASDALRLAHALDPARPVTTADFTPDAVDAYERAHASAGPQLDVRIDALTGAAVAIDGVEVGPAPIATAVTAGAHVVVVRHPRYRPRAVAIEVTAATPLVALELEPDRDTLAVAGAAAVGLAGLGDVDAARAIDVTLTYAELDEVLVVASIVRAGAPAVLGQRCVGGRACTAVVEVGYLEPAGLPAALGQLRARLARAEPRYGVILVDDPRVTRAPVRIGGGCARCRRRWYWIGGGVAVAAAAVALTILATSGDGAPSLTIDPGDFTAP